MLQSKNQDKQEVLSSHAKFSFLTLLYCVNLLVSRYLREVECSAEPHVHVACVELWGCVSSQLPLPSKHQCKDWSWEYLCAKQNLYNIRNQLWGRPVIFIHRFAFKNQSLTFLLLNLLCFVKFLSWLLCPEIISMFKIILVNLQLSKSNLSLVLQTNYSKLQSFRT